MPVGDTHPTPPDTYIQPGSRWVAKHGIHEGRAVIVEKLTEGGGVQFKTVRGTGKTSLGTSGVGKPLHLQVDHFLSRYGVPSNGSMTPAKSATAWRRPASKPAPKLPAQPEPFKPATGLILKGKTDLNIEVVDISPSMAQGWLERSKDIINRPVHQQWVQTLQQAIRRGEWQLTGDSIKMDAAGSVIDGQHRLLAIAQSGVVCQSLVVRGIHPSAFAVMDTGRGRTVGDILHLYGITDRYAKAGTVRILLLLESTGRPIDSSIESRGIVTPASTLAYLERYPEIDTGTKLADSIRTLLEGGKAVWGAAFVLMWRRDKAAADRFAYLLRTGEDLSKGNPILLLRRRLSDQHNPYFSRNRQAREELLALILKAWNLWRAGETVDQLRWSGHSRRPEAFPVPI